jgi:hypothetical protein
MNRMKKLVYKYLDDYAGEVKIGEKIIKYNPYSFIPEHRIPIYGKYGEIVCLIERKQDGTLNLSGGYEFCNMLSNIFSLDKDISWDIILNWLLKKYNMTNLQELKDKMEFLFELSCFSS